MKPEDQEFLKNTLKESSNFHFEFFKFNMQTKVQLTLAQIQFSLTLGSIALAILAIGFGTQKLNISVWSILSSTFALILLIWAITLYREIIDNQDKSLLDADANLSDTRNRLYEKVLEAKQKDDINIFLNHIRSEAKEENKIPTETNQVGEFSVFLILNTIFFGIISLLKPTKDLQLSLFLIAMSLLFSYYISFKDWSMKLINRISKEKFDSQNNSNA